MPESNPLTTMPALLAWTKGARSGDTSVNGIHPVLLETIYYPAGEKEYPLRSL
jgi:hypothetical protein